MASTRKYFLENIIVNPWEVFVLFMLPIVGFSFGVMYQEYMDSLNIQYFDFSTSPQSVANKQQAACQSDSDCVLHELPITGNLSNCCNINCVDYGQNSVAAVNRQWLQNKMANVCTQRVCPQIRALCPTNVLENQRIFHLSCINNTCRKIRTNPI